MRSLNRMRSCFAITARIARTLANYNQVAPACSPDGKWVLFTAEHGGTFDLRKVSIDGGESTSVANEFWTSSISPDGTEVASYTTPTGPDARIYTVLISMVDGRQTRVAETPAEGPQFVWSPDGKSLRYVQIDKGAGNIWEQPVSGSAPRRVSNFSSQQIFSFALSRIGKKLAMARGQTRSDVVLISNSSRDTRLGSTSPTSFWVCQISTRRAFLQHFTNGRNTPPCTGKTVGALSRI